MPSWLISLLTPLLKPLLSLGLSWLENKYPGVTSIINTIVSFLEGGASASAIQSHVAAFPNSGPDHLV